MINYIMIFKLIFCFLLGGALGELLLYKIENPKIEPRQIDRKKMTEARIRLANKYPNTYKYRNYKNK